MTYMNYKILNYRCSYQKIPEQSEKKKTGNESQTEHLENRIYLAESKPNFAL